MQWLWLGRGALAHKEAPNPWKLFLQQTVAVFGVQLPAPGTLALHNKMGNKDCKDPGMKPSIWEKWHCFGGFLRSCSKLGAKGCIKPWLCKFGFICEGGFGEIFLIFPFPQRKQKSAAKSWGFFYSCFGRRGEGAVDVSEFSLEHFRVSFRNISPYSCVLQKSQDPYS